MDLNHPNIRFRRVVRLRHSEVIHEAQDGVLTQMLNERVDILPIAKAGGIHSKARAACAAGATNPHR